MTKRLTAAPMSFPFRHACRIYRAVYKLLAASLKVFNSISDVAQRIGVTCSSEDRTAAALKRLSPGSQQVLQRISRIGIFSLATSDTPLISLPGAGSPALAILTGSSCRPSE